MEKWPGEDSRAAATGETKGVLKGTAKGVTTTKVNVDNFAGTTGTADCSFLKSLPSLLSLKTRDGNLVSPIFTRKCVNGYEAHSVKILACIPSIGDGTILPATIARPAVFPLRNHMLYFRLNRMKEIAWLR